jgi:hypothetical protein
MGNQVPYSGLAQEPLHRDWILRQALGTPRLPQSVRGMLAL